MRLAILSEIFRFPLSISDTHILAYSKFFSQFHLRNVFFFTRSPRNALAGEASAKPRWRSQLPHLQNLCGELLKPAMGSIPLMASRMTRAFGSRNGKIYFHAAIASRDKPYFCIHALFPI